ncbi:MAG: amidohydrolase family protein [Anaerolineaceae bacterium]|nr:amidohydrolase family protein [Anaerolineaceae bacterium]
MQSLEIIDAHAHVFKHIYGFGRRGESTPIGNGTVRWANGETTKLLPDAYGSDSFPYERLLAAMDEAGVAKAILLQGSYYGFANEYVHAAQSQYPERLIGMGTFDPYYLDVRDVMVRLIDEFHFRGFKFEMSASNGFMGYHPDFRIDGELMQPVFRFCAQRGLTVSLDLGTFEEASFQVEGVGRMAREYPDIQFVIEHLFFPRQDHFEEVRHNLELLLDTTNVNFSIATVPFSTWPETYPFPSACRYLALARDVVGAGRILWGTDIPSVVVHSPYRDLAQYVIDSGVLDQGELEQVFSLNARRVYRIP